MQIFPNSAATPALASVQPEDVGSSSSDSTSSASASNTATISANDFLQLLVSEMKNQDPTADTDPNEYINQLVQVNSLEQLISINQDLTPTSSSGTSGSSGSVSGGSGGQVPGTGAPNNAVTVAPGNLSAPTTGSASRIASALESAAQSLAPGSSASPLDSVLSTLRNRAQHAHTTTSNPAR
ncbi:MAG: flagellar hook capping FlgD N-terminal domain-containing protein [Acidobacteriaceae bacterium]